MDGMMNPYLLMGLGVLGNAQKGTPGIGTGMLQGLMAHQQMQRADLENQAARQALAQSGQWANYVGGLPEGQRELLTALGPSAGATYLTEAMKQQGGSTWEGSGFRAQAANLYNEYMGILAAGGTLTPEQATNLSIAHQTLTAPKNYATPEGTYSVPGLNLPAPPGMVGAPALAGPGAAGGPAAEAPGQMPAFTPKPPTESERKTRSFYERASASQEELIKLEEAGYDPSAMEPGIVRDYLGSRMKEDPSALVSLFGSVLTSPEADLYSTAAGDFIASMLRYDSGAAVPETEFARYYSVYFPIPGDGPQVRAAKSARRAAVVRALQIASGRAYTEAEQRAEMDKVTKAVEEQIPLPQVETPAAAPATTVTQMPDDPDTGEAVFQVDF